MRHLDEATLLSVRDGGPLEAGVRMHLDACATCSRALAAAQARAEAIALTLTALDGPVEATAAKAGVRARVRAAGQPAPRRWASQHLGRAAALLLVTAGAAAALPGSPVRSLLRSPATEPEVAAPAATLSESAPQALAVDAASSGISIAVLDGPVHVVVRGAAAGSELLVTWTDETAASVRAASGSRFTYAAGRVEVDASRGTVSLELPRAATRVSVEVDGRLYLSGSPEALEVAGPTVERTRESIRFRVPQG
ncbi:MAG: hypothetical protein OEO79_11665 [Gemmatimonadota bacterium]|nr:hypothetical protein [Gemmatimonadota bacterium]